MHPQLEAKRFNSCIDFIHALDQCHQREYYKRMFGLCDIEKEALSKCLHEARKNGEKEQIGIMREKRKALENKWRKMDEEEYGEDLVLKKLLERHSDKLKDSKQ